MDTIATSALFSLIAISGLVFVLGRLRSCAVDNFRQEVFALRDELFDHAAVGSISFDHPAYGMLRSTMNGFVRWADEIQILPLAIQHWISLRHDVAGQTRFEIEWEKALASLNEAERGVIVQYRKRMHQILVPYLLYGSPVLFTIVVPIIFGLVAFIGVTALVSHILSLCPNLFSGADTQAWDYGDDDPPLFPTPA